MYRGREPAPDVDDNINCNGGESAKLAPPRVIERREIRQVRDRRQIATDLEQHAVVRLRAKILERRNLRASGPDGVSTNWA